MLKPREITPAPSHEDLFIQRYEWLLSWALKLTDQDREQAEDLLHDAYIQFTFTRPEIQAIQNVEAYLYGMLRFMRLSQIRRANRSPVRPPSIVEYDSAELGLRAFDPQAQIQVQDELRRVCHYACQRKETSKAGSVLILRFFHGYYPNEIAQILKCTRPAISKWERIARAEARVFLDNPTALTFLQAAPRMEDAQIGYTRMTKDFLNELRDAVFRSKHHECPSNKELVSFYRSDADAGVEPEVLAHLVSCQGCLDTVNKTLGLPLLAERYPTDTLGKDMNAKGGGPRGGAGGGGDDSGGVVGSRGGDGSGSGKGWQRRSRQVFEHRPKELCISVNGYIQGSQKISSEVMEQSLMIDLSEPIGFVEIISEQGIRLLFQVVDLPPTGPAEQNAHIDLSDGRTLEATLNFGGPWPSLHVVYTDPTFNEALQSQQSDVVTNEADQSLTPRVESPADEIQAPKPEPQTRLGEGLSRRVRGLAASLAREVKVIGRLRMGPGVFLRPGPVTAIVALILIAALMLLQLRRSPPPLSATDLLQRSAAAEDAIAARPDTVLHRTINLEESSLDGALIGKRKIEVWASAERGITARRLYDERGSLIGGDWRRSDGVQTLYHHGQHPQLQLAPEKRGAESLLSFDSVWQLDPTAKEFTSLIGEAAVTHLDERPNAYVITYETKQGQDDNASNREPVRSRATASLIKATLVLSRPDLHAVEQTLVVKLGNDVREYHFIEASFERPAAGAVAPSVFEPEKELVSAAEPETQNSKAETTTPTTGPQPLTPVVATADLEIEVLGLLSQAGADMGEQVNVTRTPGGQLEVQGIVETDQRKAEIVRALGPVIKNSAVTVNISTVAEAVKRQPQKANPSGNVIIERPDTAGSSMAVDSELRRYFMAKGFSGNQLDEEIRQFASRTLGHSHQALRHAWALKGLADRFSADELRSLDAPARSKWLFMIRQHARALQQEIVTLRRELAPIFPGASSDEASAGIEIGSDSDLVRAIERLFDLCSEQERTVRSAFAISTDPSSAPAIKTAHFWQSLKSAERLAAQISRQ
jgi:RNA polymerase sigma factor (sigma-70 family)